MLRLPAYEEIRFRTPPLRHVLCQIKYPTILALASGTGPLLVAFQEAIRERYPFLQQLQQISIALGPESALPRAQNAWQFADAERRWTVALAPDALTLETENYSSFDDLAEQASVVLSALVENVHPGFYTRLGLRYINEIRLEDANVAIWRTLLREPWRAIFDAGIVDDGVIHWLQNLRLQVEDGVFNINVGFAQPEDPPRVIIDLDRYDESQAPLGAADTILARLNAWHEQIHSLFRWSISDELLATLERA